jgi:macrolide-specific efflux system membrane fusion protein
LIRKMRSYSGFSAGRHLMLLLAVVFSLAFAGCYFFPKEEEVLAPPIKEPEKVSYETIEVKKGTIERVIRCTGVFVSVSQVDLSYKDRGGRLKSIPVKVGDRVKKGDVVAELEAGTILNDIRLQEIAVKKSQISYDRIKTRLEIDGGGDRTELELAELDLESNKLKLASLQEELEQSRLTSTIDGQVVYTTDIKLGEYINAYQTAVRVADTSQLQLQYSDDNVGEFKLGMKPDILLNGETYKGEVVMTPGDMPRDASEELRKSIRIKIDKLPEDISIGSSASITLQLEKLEDVIVLPKQVINSFASRKFVNVLKNNIREERDVELGIQTETEAEVVKGLSVGEQVIVR